MTRASIQPAGGTTSGTRSLAEAGIGVFVVSTFDTDYLWTKEVNFGKAIEVLRAAGHTVVQ